MACGVDKLQSLCLRLKSAIYGRRCRLGKLKRRPVKISDPFDYRHVSTLPEGFDQDEMNVLREKAAVSRMVAIEDQPSTRPSTANTTSYFNNNNSQNSNSHSQTGLSSPRPQVKSRAGYRGLASSSAANHGLSYSALTESRPSITRSFATIDDTATCLSPMSSRTTSSTSTSGNGRGKKRFQSI